MAAWGLTFRFYTTGQSRRSPCTRPEAGVTVLQSGQPYSVIDYTGGAASLFWGGGQDAVTNPIVPVGGVGATATNPILQGTTGINVLRALTLQVLRE